MMFRPRRRARSDGRSPDSRSDPEAPLQPVAADVALRTLATTAPLGIELPGF